MRQNDWLQAFQTLKQRGIDPLTDNERKLRRLPIRDIKTLEEIFQPRQLEEQAASGKHIGELRRILQNRVPLDPITVMKIGGEWFCIDGHHRLQAYQQEQQGGSRKTHLPIKVFRGTLEEALQTSIKVNAPDKLNLTKEDKLEGAWKLVLLGGLSVSQTAKTASVSEKTIHRMRHGLKTVREKHPSAPVETFTWEQVKHILLNGEPKKEPPQGWEDAKARELAKSLAKTFNGVPKQCPRIFALGLCKYDSDAAQVIAEEVLRVREQARALTIPPESQDF